MSLKARWRSEKELVERSAEEESRRPKNSGLRLTGLRGAGDYGRVAEIRYGKLVENEKEISALQ
ncbi:MAG: hypothetical protein MZV63_01070 [Marinilabiliales bacterium]|nr:hypothetical protein [Marinilabiliales bacterium]